MGAQFDAAKKAQFMAFMAGETDDFDLYAVDPADHEWTSWIADGLTVDSAGGFCPFQAEGQILATAADGSTVPMRWYYRSRHGVAQLKVAMVQEETYGPSPLFSASLEEVDEFDYSNFPKNLATLIGQLEPVLYLYEFPTFALDENGRLHPGAIVILAEGGDVYDALSEFHSTNGPTLFDGVSTHAVFSTIFGRGLTSAEAAQAACRFEVDDWLVEQGVGEVTQRAWHTREVEHMGSRPWNPYLNVTADDVRQQPPVELDAKPFRTKLG